MVNWRPQSQPAPLTPPREVLDELFAFTLRVCTPLYWHDRRVPFPKKFVGGSCFVLRFGERLVGVTAAHVVQAYQVYRQEVPTSVCQLRLMPFALHAAIIDCDPDLDIATFGLSETELIKIDGVPVDCRGQWPPPQPMEMRAVSLAGFPHELIVTAADRSAVFNAYGALTAIESFTDREILFTFDPSRDQSVGGLPLPSLGLNMSGCSGGPALMHGTKNGLQRWFPVGVIHVGPKRDAPEPIARGEAEAFDMIRVRRINFLREDGTINRPSDGGWLPGRG